MAIRRINVERFSVISSKSFEDTVAALKAAGGQPITETVNSCQEKEDI